MKIVTFFLACMACIKSTIAPSRELEEAAFVFSLSQTLRDRSTVFCNSNRLNAAPRILPRDHISIYKVVDGEFKDFDIIAGRLYATELNDDTRPLGYHPVNHNLRGEAQVTLGNPNHGFRAYMVPTPNLRVHPYGNTLKYFCTIETGEFMHLVAVLEQNGEQHIPHGAPKVQFTNDRYKTPGYNYVFSGELFEPTRENIRNLMNRLVGRQQL